MSLTRLGLMGVMLLAVAAGAVPAPAALLICAFVAVPLLRAALKLLVLGVVVGLLAWFVIF